MQRSSFILLAWCGCSFIPILPGLGRGQEATAFNPAAAEKLYGQARKVAPETGLTQPAEVSFRLARGDEPLPIDPATDGQLRWLFPELRGEAFDRARRVAQEAVAATAVAAPGDPSQLGTIILFPERAAQMARWHPSLERATSPEFLQLSLVYLGALQFIEEHYHLRQRFESCRDGEEFQVLLSLRDGYALWLTQAVAARLGSAADARLLADVYLHVPDIGGDNALRLVRQQVLRQCYRAAADGLAFFESLARHGSLSVDGVFQNPPRQVAWLRKPELYTRSLGAGKTDLKALLARLEQAPPAAEWQASQQPWTADMVRQVAALLGQRDPAERALRAWEEARSLVWRDTHNLARQVALSVVRFVNEPGARSYYGFALDLQRKRDEACGNACTSAMRISDSRTHTVAVASADEAVRLDKRIQVGTKGEPLAESILLARKGSLVVELTWYGVAPDPAWAKRTLAAVLSP